MSGAHRVPFAGARSAPAAVPDLASVRLSDFQSLQFRPYILVSRDCDRSPEQRQNFFLNCARDASIVLAHVHIYFAANAEFRQINSRLDGKAGVRHDFAVVARFEPVHVCAVAVNFLADAVPGAMDEIFRVARFTNRLARDVVHFPSVNRASARYGFLHEIDGAVPGTLDDSENFRVGAWNAFAEIADPGDVVIHAARLREFRPHVEQQQITGANRARRVRFWLVVRVTVVRLHRGDGRLGRNQTVRVKFGEHPLLQLEFGDRLALAHETGRTLKSAAA